MAIFKDTWRVMYRYLRYLTAVQACGGLAHSVMRLIRLSINDVTQATQSVQHSLQFFGQCHLIFFGQCINRSSTKGVRQLDSLNMQLISTIVQSQLFESQLGRV